MTAILATVGALVSYQGGATQNAALLFKNESAIKKTEASDQWAFYQSKSNKQNLAELGAVLTTAKVADDYRAEAERYKKEKEKIMVDAKALEQASRDAEGKSEESMHLHHRWAQSMALIQVAIALAAITLPHAPEMAAVDGLRCRYRQPCRRRAGLCAFVRQAQVTIK